MASMLEFRTPGFNPYAVKYSPYFDSRIAVASAANYGIVGNGRLFCLGLGPQGIQVEKTFDTNDAQYDLAWSEINENQLLAACGDGSIKLYDVNVTQFPVMNFHEHKRETFSVAWSPVTKDTFASSSWDGTIKIVLVASAARVHQDVTSRQLHLQHLVLPVEPQHHLRRVDRLAPAHLRPAHARERAVPPHDQDPRARDARRPFAPGVTPSPAMPAEILTHDWNKYNDTVIATGGVDRVIRTFDIRNPSAGPASLMTGHGYAVRRLAWSPHARDILISASYDMTVRLWTDGSTMAQQQPVPSPVSPGVQLGVMNRHTEFVTGVDWCLFGVGGWVATVGWDERVLLWDANALLQGRG
ncbi:WD domain-containing protein [Apiospora arundinis]